MPPNIVIPMAGLGSRFEKAGYSFPKPLIDVNGKPMIQVVVENLNIEGKYIFIVQKEHYDKYQLKYLLELITSYNNCEIVVIDGLTEGAACTVLKAKEFIDNKEELIVANSDQWVDWNAYHFLDYARKKEADGLIASFHACFGYRTLIDTKEYGKIHIGKIVKNKLPCSVLSYNQKTKEFEYTPITNYIRINGNNCNWSKIKSKWGGITYSTDDHNFLTKSGLWEKIGKLVNGNIKTIHKTMNPTQKEIFNGTMLGDGCINKTKQRINSGLKFGHSKKQIDWFKSKLNVFKHFGINARSYITKEGYETDFFARHKISGDMKLIQVCWDMLDNKTSERELRGLKSAMNELSIPSGTIITWDDETALDNNIDVVPIWKWLIA